MKDDKQFVVGQFVRVSGGYGKPVDRPIDKVGRKYVTIGGVQYEIETQSQKDGYSGSFRTLEQVGQDERRSQVVARIKKAQTTYGDLKLPLEALEKIAEIVDEYTMDSVKELQK